MQTRKLLSISMATLLTLGHASVAQAHARLVSSQPADGSRLEAAPKQLRLVFNSLVETRFGRFSLMPPQGQAIALAHPPQKDRVSRELVIPLPPLKPGRYTLSWSVVARDSHRVEGTLTFSVD